MVIMRIKTFENGKPKTYMLARGNLWEMFCLLFRGYRPHKTMVYWFMMKEWRTA